MSNWDRIGWTPAWKAQPENGINVRIAYQHCEDVISVTQGKYVNDKFVDVNGKEIIDVRYWKR